MRHGVMATPGQDGTTHDYYYDVRIIMYESSYPVTVHTPLCTFFFAIVDISTFSRHCGRSCRLVPCVS